MSDLCFLPAIDMANAVRQRHISAQELLEAHLEQIKRHNPALNVVVTLDEQGAQQRAKDADEALDRGEVWGPLHGVPFTVKDAFATAGLRTTSGFPPLADYIPPQDAPVVANLRDAGAVLLGKTNLPTFSLDVQVNNPIFGRTNNPWDQSRTSGGSTGGAAGVAAGFTPLELGSDLGGSVRIPAHCCGIYALKPTDYRFPTGGYHPDPRPRLPDPGGPAQMSVHGPLARSVEDLALAFRILAGSNDGQWSIPPVPVGEMHDLEFSQIRLAWTDDFNGIPVSSESRDALHNLVKKLEEQGFRVEQLSPEWFDLHQAWELWGEITGVIIGLDPETAASFGYRLDAESLMIRSVAKGTRLKLQEHQTNLSKRSVLINNLEKHFTSWDAIICPVMSVPAFPHCEPSAPIRVDDQSVEYWTASISFTCPFNLTGHPVVAIPAAQSQSGLPIGTQLVGKRWHEMHLLSVAKRISEIVGPYQPPPGY